MPSSIPSPIASSGRFLRQRQRLRVVELRILHYRRVYADTHNFVSTLHHIAFRCDEDIIAIQKESAFVSVDALRRIAVVLERDGRRRGRTDGGSGSFLLGS